MPDDVPFRIPAFEIPYALDLNTAMQTLATIVLWGGTAALLGYAAMMARRQRSILPVALVVAVAAASILEPIYDIAYHLFWLDNGQQWTLFTAFGLPQPVWVMPAYVMVFGLPALLLYKSMSQGTSLRFIFTFAGVTTVTTAAFEITAINLDLYTYYGDAPMRLLHYPLFIAFMESAQITGFAVLAALLQLRATKQVHFLALFALFPANFFFDVLGAGFPVLIAMNVPDPNDAVMLVTAFLSIGLAATCLWWTGKLLVSQQRLAVAAQGGTPPAAPSARPAATTADGGGAGRAPQAARAPAGQA